MIKKAPYSKFIITPLNSQLIFFSGVVGINMQTREMEAKGFSAEVSQMFKNLRSNLDEAKVETNQILKVTVVLKDINKYCEFN